MKQQNSIKLWIRLLVIFASIAALMLLIYFVIVISFQKGEQSVGITTRMAEKVARILIDNPTKEEIKTVGVMIRCGAHLVVFFVVGAVTAYVSMLIFRRYFRIIGIMLSCMACYSLAYYTEYYKQFVEGRHFHLIDVSLNWYGSLAGISCMVGSYFLSRLLVKLS